MYSAAYLGRRANLFSNGVNNEDFHTKNVLPERSFRGQNNPRMKVYIPGMQPLTAAFVTPNAALVTPKTIQGGTKDEDDVISS